MEPVGLSRTQNEAIHGLFGLSDRAASQNHYPPRTAPPAPLSAFANLNLFELQT